MYFAGTQRRPWLVGLLWLAACSAPAAVDWRACAWLPCASPTRASLRGLAAVDGAVAWVSGQGGTLLRTVDGGRSWRDVAPPDASSCDFRDLHAFDADTALAMVAGQPARVYRTEDGGASWRIVHEDARPATFFDGLAFHGDTGFLFGDPVDGAFQVLRSGDAGRSWQPVSAPALPRPEGDEAGFAASGTNLAVLPGGGVRITTGGAAARCLASDDGGATWTAMPLPLQHGTAAQGAFSVGFHGSARGVVVGGDYADPRRGDATAAWTEDGGASWHAAVGGAGGYRSAALWLDASHVLAVGETGASLSRDSGRSWEPFGATGFHALGRGSDGSVWACGGDGRIARLEPAALGEALPFRTTRLFGDHMVLPASQQVPIRGFGPAGAEVVARGSWGAAATARVQPDGRWTCTLALPGRGGPYEVALQCGAERLVLRDVLVGDVWLCSGQSNMEMTVGDTGEWRTGVRDWQAEVAAADHAGLRVFTVGKRASGAPLDDVEGQWQVCSPRTAAGFSAVGYFFGRELLQRGKGPVGLVVSAWGGTVCEAWTSGDGLRGFPEFGKALAATRLAAQPGSREAQREAFWRAVETAPAVGDAVAVELPELWSKAGLADFDGVVTYRRRLTLPAAFVGRDLVLELGAIDDMDTVVWNGVRVGGHDDDGSWTTARRYTVPAAQTVSNDVDLAVRVVDTGGEGGFSGPPAALRLSLAGDGSASLPLAGGWQRQRGPALRDLPAWPRADGGNPNRPAVLWNGMIAPLVPFPFTGALWYQGESNRSRAEQYAKLFPAMIRDWRSAFGRELPFHFVQIAPFDYGPERGETPALRQAQEAALALPHTGMVVTLDVGEAADIHPRDKQSVGRRLALQALRDPHGQHDVVADGPRPRAVVRRGASLHITFDGAEGGLRAAGELAGFEVAGADGAFAAATAAIDGNAVVVSSAAVPEPQHVRYGWAAVPKATLQNRAGLPAWPFRRSL